MTDNGKGMMEALIAIVDASSVGISDSGTQLVVMQVTDRFSSILMSTLTVRGLPRVAERSLGKNAGDISECSHL